VTISRTVTLQERPIMASLNPGSEMEGLSKIVEGEHYFDTLVDEVLFEFRRFVSIATVENRKIVRWRDYMDSLAAWTALNKPA
jgi:hypothetical protein